ncbi:MAG: hypothetical protein ACI4U3_02605 [Traorella sp.]
MGLEQFFEAISFVCIKLLPLLGVVLLIYLIIMIRDLISCLRSATKTIDEANLQLRKLDIPLHTVSEISKSVDQVHELTKESVKSLSLSIYEILNKCKDKFNQLLHKEKEEVVNVQSTQTQEPSKEE